MFSDERYAQPSARTRGVSEKRRPSERTWPSFSSVSRIRRAVALVMPARRATSLSVSAERSAEKTCSTASPRSSDWSDGCCLGSAFACVIGEKHLQNDRKRSTVRCSA